jgi:hypothetical protein
MSNITPWEIAPLIQVVLKEIVYVPLALEAKKPFVLKVVFSLPFQVTFSAELLLLLTTVR